MRSVPPLLMVLVLHIFNECPDLPSLHVNPGSPFTQELLKSKLPIVAHNALYDMLFTVKAFDRPLPPTLREFKTILLDSFPGHVYDTKHVCSQDHLFQDPMWDTSLESVFHDLVLSQPSYKRNVLLAPGFEVRPKKLGCFPWHFDFYHVYQAQNLLSSFLVDQSNLRTHYPAYPKTLSIKPPSMP